MTADPRKWRIERFEALGFSYHESVALADSRDRNGVPVYWPKVEAALGAGLSHAQALEIFVEEEQPLPPTALVIEGSE
jgi:hypothetical protein